jgi:hypothetical protein
VFCLRWTAVWLIHDGTVGNERSFTQLERSSDPSSRFFRSGQTCALCGGLYRCAGQIGGIAMINRADALFPERMIRSSGA